MTKKKKSKKVRGRARNTLRVLPLVLVPLSILLAIVLLTPQAAPVVFAQPAGWIELVGERTRVGKTYLNLANPSQRSLTTGLTPVHYESVLDSDVYDAEVDLTPRRINNTELDGWTVTNNGWHYALGKPGDKTTDGWIGFGGRQGDHWVKFRLARVGYLHGPTRTWDDLGGLPTYDRAQLTSTTSETEYGHGNMVTVQTTATWANIWTTPGGGSLDISWRAGSSGLKEDIIINEAARDWLTNENNNDNNNGWPYSETWFGFVLEVDWSDIPEAILNGTEIDLSSDFTDTGDIELRDALDRLVAFVPTSEVRVPTGDPLNPFDTRPLQKRFWLDGDGNHYVLMGIRVPELAGMAAGDLIFDPTVNEEVGADLDDGFSREGYTLFFDSLDYATVGNARNNGGENIFARFTTVAIPQGAQIDIANFTFTNRDLDSCGACKTNIYFEDADDAVAPTSAAEHQADIRTTAFVAWDDLNPVAVSSDYTSPSIVSVVQEVISRSGWSTGSALMLLWDDDTSGFPQYIRARTLEHVTDPPIQLDIEYSTPWSNTAPTISNPITSVTTNLDEAYARSFSATDPDTNQTLAWELNTTDAPFTITVWNGGNRTTWVNATPDTVGSFYVNVTVGDDALGPSGNETDWVNYTLNVVETSTTWQTYGFLIFIGFALMFTILGLLLHGTASILVSLIGGLAWILSGFNFMAATQETALSLLLIMTGAILIFYNFWEGLTTKKKGS